MKNWKSVDVKVNDAKITVQVNLQKSVFIDFLLLVCVEISVVEQAQVKNLHPCCTRHLLKRRWPSYQSCRAYMAMAAPRYLRRDQSNCNVQLQAKCISILSSSNDVDDHWVKLVVSSWAEGCQAVGYWSSRWRQSISEWWMKSIQFVYHMGENAWANVFYRMALVTTGQQVR